jgi:pyruvate dehydrogenase E2 component (dihydrolipoamide acetyltransferase)
MERCVECREQLRLLANEDAPSPTYTDIIVRACALALRQHPRANGAFKQERLELHSRVNVGLAVATPNGLVVPVVQDADLKSLPEIAVESSRLVARAREGTITPPELSGGTFTLSNLGMFGIDYFTAIINPPQAAILAVGAITSRPAAQQGEIVLRRIMDVILTCDHRILYGIHAAAFLACIRELLQRPEALDVSA